MERGYVIPTDSRLCAVLTADICGSTRLYESVGDDAAYRLIANCISELAGNISTNDGHVIKTMGDGILSIFTSAVSAFDAAVAMQQDRRDSSILIRVGINYGSVVRKDGDVFGDCVNVSAHLLTLSKPGEIIITGEMAQNLPSHLRSRTQLFHKASLKGKSELTDFYRVTAGEQENDITRISGNVSMQGAATRELVLLYRGRKIVIAEEGKDFTIGRNEDCDLIADGPFVSRSHATIKAQRGIFYLVDHSANGTYVVYDRGDPIFLKRQTLRLGNEGEIFMNPLDMEDASEPIKFHCGDKSQIGVDTA